MIDAATVREQFQRFSRQWDDNSLLTDYADLVRRYLSQPLSDSETAWAYQTLANVLACSEHAAEAVDVHEAFERWLPGNSPRLSATFPHYPATDASPHATIGADEIRVHFLGQSVQFAAAYGAIGRYSDFISKADAALAGVTPTPENASARFYAVRIYMTAALIAGDFEGAERYLRAMHAIADEAGAPELASLQAMALLAEIDVARWRNDEGRRSEKLRQALSLLEEVERTGPADWLRGYRHELAHLLIQRRSYDLALPVLDAKLAAGDGSHGDHGYAWLMHAAAVWKVTRDRPRTLALLREARDHDPRDLTNDFRTSAFEDVQDDPEFLQAISRSG